MIFVEPSLILSAMEHVDFLTDLAIVLAAAFLGGALLQKLRQPVLVGYIVVGIILGLVFFLSVGLLIDFEFFVENIVPVLILLFVAMCLKTVVNISVLRLLGLSGRHAVVIGATLGQIGEFSFVLAALGLAAGTIGSEGHKLVVLIIALSLMATPFWMVAVRRVGIIGRRLKGRIKANGITMGRAP